ncbi:hypothetical protein BDZ97DRAFT_1343509 [Flammula alnicola]|nr:hypothetical protein BDZ97DRAFT_1343509 [Flammula alnicola]
MKNHCAKIGYLSLSWELFRSNLVPSSRSVLSIDVCVYCAYLQGEGGIFLDSCFLECLSQHPASSGPWRTANGECKFKNGSSIFVSAGRWASELVRRLQPLSSCRRRIVILMTADGARISLLDDPHRQNNEGSTYSPSGKVHSIENPGRLQFSVE